MIIIRRIEQLVLTQRCPGPCGIEKPLSDFYENEKTGRTSTLCKECHNAKSKAVYTAEKAANPIQPKPMVTEKKCRGKCERTLPIETFGFRDATKTIRRSYCGQCHNEQNAALKVKNREKIRVQSRIRYARNKDRISAAVKIKRAANPAPFRAREARWKRENPEKSNTHTHNRRARLALVPGSHTDAEWEFCKSKYNYTCLWCRRREPEIALSRDHVISISSEGTNNDITNIQPLCGGRTLRDGGCQYRKGSQSFDLRSHWPGPLPESITMADGTVFSLTLPVLSSPIEIIRRHESIAEKRCIDCKEIKPISEFSFRNKSKGYHRQYCKNPCQIKRNAKRKDTYIPKPKVPRISKTHAPLTEKICHGPKHPKGALLPISEFGWRVLAKGTYKAHCRECVSIENEKRYPDRLPKEPKPAPTSKVPKPLVDSLPEKYCNGCKKIQPIDNFGWHNVGVRRQPICKKCQKEENAKRSIKREENL